MVAASNTTGERLHALITERARRDDRIYALIDAARDWGLVRDLWGRLGFRSQWLFSPDTGAEMEPVAPYLLGVPFRHAHYPFPGSEFLDLWIERLGRNVGILLSCPADFDSVHSHLFRTFRATDENDNGFFFRFYDPRVLRMFLPTCTRLQQVEFFGPLRNIFLEGGQPGTMTTCWRSERTIEVATTNLGTSAASRPSGGTA